MAAVLLAAVAGCLGSLIAGGIVLGYLSAAEAEPPSGVPSPLHAWWEGAKVPSGGLCCGIADGRLALARQDDDGWLVLLDGAWRRVPKAVVLHDYPPHPSGSAAVWLWGGEIRCFVPPTFSG